MAQFSSISNPLRGQSFRETEWVTGENNGFIRSGALPQQNGRSGAGSADFSGKYKYAF